ncbi:MAG: dihydrodipicolinate synthase family protein [Pseudomonadota bacterium]
MALRGVVTPILTPFEADGSIAIDLWVAHARWLLEEGTHFLSPFGTTGEALSVSSKARMAAVEALVSAGIPADRLIPGTGLCALEETRALTAHARDLGCAGAMTLPPFFYTGASEDGLVRFFDALIAAEGRPGFAFVLYHIPSHAGVGISPSLAARLHKAHPEQIAGYKDSSGDWENTVAVIEAAPGLSVFPGSEAFLSKGWPLGAAGCISATCNINAGQIRRLFDALDAGTASESLDAEVKEVRGIIQGAGLIPAMKSLLAHRLGEPRWLNTRPPLMPVDAALGPAIAEQLGQVASHVAA